jgi:murein DD-endopeptidase MepM/ murein hydrolase activator NlpD
MRADAIDTSDACADKSSDATKTCADTHRNLYVPGAPGCHCVPGVGIPSWMMVHPWSGGGEDAEPEAYASARAEAVTVQLVDSDAGASMLQLTNRSLETVAAYISASCAYGAGSLKFFGGDGEALQVGEACVPLVGDCDNGKRETKRIDCITFVATAPAQSVTQLAHADPRPFVSGEATISLQTIPFETNGWGLFRAPPPELCFAQFPLPAPGPYLCTQGCGGMLTHYFAQSFHAFDFRCPVGTPLLAMADGVITILSEEATASGIHCDNLYRWNAIGLRTERGITVMYVHIQPHSALVALGDTVREGQPLCLSGNIGFSPEPHVHIEAHVAAQGAAKGHSVPLYLLANASSPGEPLAPYIPEAGRYYGPHGVVSPPTA